MKMERRKLRIGDLAEQLDVKRFVIRFWEKEFDMASSRSDGGQRHYDNTDYQRFSLIKKLLYEDRLTIEGAKKILKEQAKQEEQNKIQVQASSKISQDIFLGSSSAINSTETQLVNISNQDSTNNLQENNHGDNRAESYFEKEKILSKLDGMNIEKLIELQKKLIKLREVL